MKRVITPKSDPPKLEGSTLEPDPRIAAAAQRYSAICSPAIAHSNAERLIAAIDAGNIAALSNLLHSGNRISRAIFEDLTLTTLPTNQLLRLHLERWAQTIQATSTAAETLAGALEPPVLTARTALEGYLESLAAHQRDKHRLALRKQMLHRNVITTTAAFIEDLARGGFELQTHRLNGALEHHAVLNEQSYQLSAVTGAYLEHLRSEQR